jgi:hypothetical protein
VRSALSLLGAIVIAACSSEFTPSPETTAASLVPGRACPEGNAATYESFAGPFFLSWCTGCHSSSLDEAQRRGAPANINFDRLEDIKAHALRIFERAADDHLTMPPAGGPTKEQRKLLGDWLGCGAPGVQTALDAGTGESSRPPPPTGACAASRPALPPSLLPRCSAATLTCIESCGKLPESEREACTNKCYADDTTPPSSNINCASCVYYQLLSCSDRNGCHDAVANFYCCGEQKCSRSTDPECFQKQCAAETQAMGLCLYYVTPQCNDFYGASSEVAQCFAK